MRKNSFIYSLASALMMGALALSGLTACSSSNDTIEEKTPEAKKYYPVRIHATMNDDAETRAVSFDNTGEGPTCSSFFTEGEKVFITPLEAAHCKIGEPFTTDANGSELIKGISLTVTNVTNDGKSCELVGYIPTSVEPGDKLMLMYNINNYDFVSGAQALSSADCYYDYTLQDGTAAGVLDGAEAYIEVKTVPNPETSEGEFTFVEGEGEGVDAIFYSEQSMFRFQFVNKDNNVAISVKSLEIFSKNVAFAQQYNPNRNQTDPYTAYGSIPVTLASATSDFIYVALCINENRSDGDLLIFTVTDGDGKHYIGSKSAPTGDNKFINGKYYYNSSPIQLTEMVFQEPTIEGINVEPNGDSYNVNGKSTFTISGTSVGYRFFTNDDAIITLNNLTATYPTDNFLYSSSGDITLDITGTNEISCIYANNCIYTGGNLKLKGEGTLTVTASFNVSCGLWASNYDDQEGNEPNTYNHYNETGSFNVTNVLAVEGYAVTRSVRKTNDDGTYTWTYYVMPLEQPTVNPGSVTTTSTLTGNSYSVHGLSTGNDNPPYEPSEIEISGTSKGYNFFLDWGSTVTLNDLTATYWGDQFIYGSNMGESPNYRNLNFVISGTNTINCKGASACIHSEGYLKLSGNGTLTITASNKDVCGLEAVGNYIYLDNDHSTNWHATEGQVDVSSALAAEGYTVTRSARTDNADGSYTWTYNVSKNPN